MVKLLSQWKGSKLDGQVVTASVTVSGMARKPAVYVGPESARMAELEGIPLASFTARPAVFAIDMTTAAASFIAVNLARVIAAIKLGWRRDYVHIAFDPFHIDSSHQGQWQSVIQGQMDYQPRHS